ncbi:hypothetical protein ZWY2020_055833 [Hordeum vulgare]|nr:hypothetical protein ZWY2020_055833 [Hordeum vulgare]
MMPILVSRSSSVDEIGRIRSQAKCVDVSHDALPAEFFEEDDVTSHCFSPATMPHPRRGRLPEGSAALDATGSEAHCCEPSVKPNGEAAKEAALDGVEIHQRRGSASRVKTKEEEYCCFNSAEKKEAAIRGGAPPLHQEAYIMEDGPSRKAEERRQKVACSVREVSPSDDHLVKKQDRPGEEKAARKTNFLVKKEAKPREDKEANLSLNRPLKKQGEATSQQISRPGKQNSRDGSKRSDDRSRKMIHDEADDLPP